MAKTRKAMLGLAFALAGAVGARTAAVAETSLPPHCRVASCMPSNGPSCALDTAAREKTSFEPRVFDGTVHPFGPAPDKKCITIGWEFIYTPPAEIAKHADAYADCGISGADFTIYGTLPDGRKISSQATADDPAWTREAFSADEEALRRLTRLPAFSYSFVHAVRCPRKRIAWTDDGAWARYAGNVRIAAAIAKACGAKGVSCDNEDYGASRQFKRIDGDPGYDEAVVLARRRGREIFGALFAEFPDAVVHCDRLLTGDLWNYYINARDPQTVARTANDLWPAFVNGALDAIPPGAVLVEGDETGYRYEAEHHDYFEARTVSLKRLARLVVPENRIKYDTQVKMAFPVYLDRFCSSKPGSRYWAGPVDGSRAAHFERNFNEAFAATDDYVWLYAEQYVFGRWERDPKKGYKGRDKGLVTWDDKIEGLADALNAAQYADEFARRRLAELEAKGTLTNLFADVFQDGPLPKPLSCWQAKEQPGVFGAKDGCLYICGVGRGGIAATFKDVQTGEYYAIRFQVKGNTGSTIVRFHRKGGAADLTFPHTTVLAPPTGDENGWREVVGLVRVPQDTDSMLVSIGVGQKPDETTLIRKAGLYRILKYGNPENAGR